MKFNKNVMLVSMSVLAVGSVHPVLAAFGDTGTDYATRTAQTNVYTPGSEALDTVNNILCFVGQLKASEFINKGVYTALVDESKCNMGDSDNDDGKAISQIKVIVETTRVDNDSPQIAKFWIPEFNVGDDTPVIGSIKAYATISNAPTATDPYQDFTMHYDMIHPQYGLMAQGQIVSTPSSDLEGGNIGLKFYEEMNGGEVSEVSAVNVIKQPDGSSGNAITLAPGETTSSIFGLSWDEAILPGRVKIKSTGNDISNNTGFQAADTQMCMNTTAESTSVWRYGLYYQNDVTIDDKSYTAGQEVELNSGFPILFDDAAGDETQGYIGYWGLWTEGDIIPTSTIYKVDYSESVPTKKVITMETAPGKLWKNTIEILTLDDIDGIKFEYHDGSPIEIEYDSTDSAWYKTGTIAWDNDINGMKVTAVTPVVYVFGSVNIHLWSEQIGNITVDSNDAVLQTTRTIVSPADELFDSSDTAVTLSCYDRCLKSEISEGEAATYTGPYLSGAQDYNFARTNMTLNKGAGTGDNDAVKFTSSATVDNLQGSPYQYGIYSGALIADSTDKATVNNDITTLYDGTITTWYEWETGIQNWNKSTVVKEGTELIVFDAPLELKLAFSESNARKDEGGSSSRFDVYKGQNYNLGYGGNGEVWNIPFEQADNDRYYPVISIADGGVIEDRILKDDNGNTINYVVKAWDMEKKYDQDISAGACGVIEMKDVAGGLPTEIDQSLGTNTEAVPTLSDDNVPSVINGVVQ